MVTFFLILIFGYLIIEFIKNYWYILLIILAIFIGLIALSIYFSDKARIDAQKKYEKEIKEVALIYSDFVKVAKNLDGFVHVGADYLYVKLDNCSPSTVKDYYEGKYDWGIPYNEDFHKEYCLKNFEDCNHIDKELVWSCIMDRIHSRNFDGWGKYGEWAFEYPIFCPEALRQNYDEIIKSVAENYMKKESEKKEKENIKNSDLTPVTQKPVSSSTSVSKSSSAVSKTKYVYLRSESSGEKYLIRSGNITTIGTKDCKITAGYSDKHIMIWKCNNWYIADISKNSRKSIKVRSTINGSELKPNIYPYTRIEGGVELKNGDKIILSDGMHKSEFVFYLNK